jgi:hypothetical protein
MHISEVSRTLDSGCNKQQQNRYSNAKIAGFFNFISLGRDVTLWKI